MKFMRRAVKSSTVPASAASVKSVWCPLSTIGRHVLQVVEQLKEDAIAEREALLLDGCVAHDQVQVGKD